MLNLESRMEILGITVFQDSDRPNQFFYLPGSPHITYEQGQPLFDLYAYNKGGQSSTTLAGGFLNMTVDLGIGNLKDRIEQRLKEQFGDDVTLASVPISKGTARVIALGEDSRALQGGVEAETAPSGDPLVAKGPRFIQNILGAGTPSLDGENRAIFSFSLSEDGTAFFMGVLGGNPKARPVGVVYELEYIGLLPAYDLQITIDFKSCYEYMRSRFTLGTLLFRADIDNIVEELQRRESIKIKEVSRTLELSTPEAIRERQTRIDQLVKDLATGSLFQPALTPGEPRVRQDTISAADPTNTAPTNTTSAAAAALRQGIAPAIAVGMQEAYGRSAGATGEANPAGDNATDGSSGSGNAGGSSSGNSGTTGGTAGGTTGGTTGNPQQPETAADVWNRLGRPQAAFALRNLRQEEQRTVTYNLTQVTAQKQTIAPQSFVQFLADSRDLNQHVQLIDLNHPFFQKLTINVNASDVDYAAEGITQMTVHLRYGTQPNGTAPKDTAEVLLRSREDSRDFTFFLDRKLTRSYEYKLIVDYRNNFGIGIDDVRMESPWISTEAASLAVHPRWLGRVLPVSLHLAPNLGEDVNEVQARVRYVNAARAIDDSTLVKLNAQTRQQTVHIRLADTNEQFEVAPTVFYKDGTKEDLPLLHLPDPTSGSADEAVVIATPRANRLDADVIMLDALGELNTVIVDAQVLQNGTLLDSRSFDLVAPGKPERWSVRLPERDRLPLLRYRERRLYRDGGMESEEWHESGSSSLVVGIPAEGTFNVTAIYVGPKPSALGLTAIILNLEYKDPNGDPRFDQQTSLLIDDNSQSHRLDWKIRLADRQSRSYRWQMTLLFEDGTDSSTEFKTDSRKDLILRSPQL